ncbi:MAG TPA: LTA synthase family protein [Enterococcus columbae]|nr:LTA synthase family protein [Enterococcus columbae]
MLNFFFYCAFYLTKITFLYKDKALFNRKHRQRFLSIVALGSLIFSSIYAIKELRLTEVYTAYFDQSTFIQKEYVKPQAVNLQFPRQKKNLIHIYLESIENSYFDQANGGYMKENLMPDLMNLAKEGIHFSSNNKFGGPIQTYGSSWSVAAMVNMSSGLPLKIPMDGNSYGKTGQFLPGAVMIGDILQEQGYNQTIMFGADADFGGLTSFFKTHGNYHIFDVKYARKAGLIPPNYNVWWGFEDNKLYEFTKQELTRLASLNQPFNFTMENADTHFPDGFVEPDMPKLYTSQYANVIHYSQKQVVDLVRWIQQQPFYKDTVIVLTGDHPSMNKKFFENFDPNYQRTTFNLILNADFPNQTFSTKNRQYAPYDYFPTILASMGVKIKDERLGLGVNLASSQPTLIEKYGLKKVNQELSKNSCYYNNEFVDEKWAKK